MNNNDIDLGIVGVDLVTKHYNEPLGGTWHLGFGSAR